MIGSQIAMINLNRNDYIYVYCGNAFCMAFVDVLTPVGTYKRKHDCGKIARGYTQKYYLFLYTCNSICVIEKAYCAIMIAYLSLVVRNPVFGVSDTNRAVQQQKMARGLKFRIKI